MSDVTGLDNVLRNLDREMQNIKKRTKKGTRKAAEFILNEAAKITPMSPMGSGTSGDLRKSGKTRLEEDPNGIDGIISFGDGRVNYAAAVHEMPTNSNWSEQGTGNKYLERTIRKYRDKALRYIEEAVRIP